MRTVKSVTAVGKRPVYDISVSEAEHYVLENGVVTHNTGGMYSAMQVFIIGKSQEKEKIDGKDQLAGYNFTINIEKSRFVKEKSKFPFTVKFAGGINKWSGLLDLALESGHVIKPKNGWYQKVNMETGEIGEKSFREKDTNSGDFWDEIIEAPSFNKFVETKFLVSNSTLVSDEDDASVYETLDEE